MACGGVVVCQLVEEQHHFHHPSLAGQLAAAIAQTLAEMEETESHDTIGAEGSLVLLRRRSPWGISAASPRYGTTPWILAG